MFFPFSQQAKQIELQQPSESTLEKCTGFIRSVVKKEVKKLPELPPVETVECYAACNALLSALPYPVQGKFAEAYAFLALGFFRSNPGATLEYGREVFPSLKAEGENFSIGFFEFLAAEHDVSRQSVEKGKVIIDFEGLCVALAEGVRRKRMALPSGELPLEFKEAARKLSAELFTPPPGSGQSAFLSAPCIEKVKAGLGEGQRYYGSLALSIACHADGLNHNEARQLLVAYANACKGGGQSYTEREAVATLDWVYHRGISYFTSLRGTPFEAIHCECGACPVKIGTGRQRGLIA